MLKILFHPRKKSFEFAILIHSFKSFSKIWIINHILALYFELSQLACIFASFSRCLFFVCSLNLINKLWIIHFWSNTEFQKTSEITTDLLYSTKQNTLSAEEFYFEQFSQLKIRMESELENLLSRFEDRKENLRHENQQVNCEWISCVVPKKVKTLTLTTQNLWQNICGYLRRLKKR